MSLEDVLKKVSEKKLINDVVPSIDLIDLDYITERVEAIKDAFPEDFILNAVAMKANSIRGVLKHAQKMGMGGEGASICEVEHAISLGFPPEMVIYDSPVKSMHDLKRALDLNVYINLDNEIEVDKMNQLLSGPCANTKSKIGLRINPCVGGGVNEIMNTAIITSKFGVPVNEDTLPRVIDLYKQNPWLTGIHIHVGSQGVPLELFVQGSKVCMDTVKAIERECGRDLETIDIGGGISSSYNESTEPKGYEFVTYRKMLDDLVPELFTGKYKIITEFGRSVFLKSGITVSHVEHVKHWIAETKPIILLHVGSNQFVREAYLPDKWRHRFSVADSKGKFKTEGNKIVYDIAGPMCFQGDYLAKNVELNEVKDKDWIIIHDSGAYTMAMYSKYNSILPSCVYGYSRSQDGSIKLFCFKERETCEENLLFWGLEQPREIQ